MYCNSKGTLESKERKFKEKKERETELKSIFLKCLVWRFFLPQNVALSRLDSDKAVSRKCGFSHASFLHSLGDPHLWIRAWDIALRLVWKQLTLSFLYSKSVHFHGLDKTNSPARGIFFVLLGGQATPVSWWATVQWLHALLPLLFFSFKGLLRNWNEQSSI